MTGGWFVTGTDTGVGKTSVSEALLHALAGRRGQRAIGMKPVASGCRRTPDGLRSDDVERLLAAGNVAAHYADLNTYSFEPAIAPHIAAAQAGVDISLFAIHEQYAQLAARSDWLVVEGAGGWYVPINHKQTLADLARRLALPVILVVGVRLGCINHALLSARAIRADNLTLAGWVANHVDAAVQVADETVAALEQRLAAPCLTRIPFGADTTSWRTHGAVMAERLLSDMP